MARVGFICKKGQGTHTPQSSRRLIACVMEGEAPNGNNLNNKRKKKKKQRGNSCPADSPQAGEENNNNGSGTQEKKNGKWDWRRSIQPLGFFASQTDGSSDSLSSPPESEMMAKPQMQPIQPSPSTHMTMQSTQQLQHQHTEKKKKTKKGQDELTFIPTNTRKLATMGSGPIATTVGNTQRRKSARSNSVATLNFEGLTKGTHSLHSSGPLSAGRLKASIKARLPINSPRSSKGPPVVSISGPRNYRNTAVVGK